MMHLLRGTMIVLSIAIWPRPVLAQWEEYSAHDLVRLWQEKGDRRALSAAMCPVLGSRADTVFTLLIALPWDRARAHEFASWRAFTPQCKDERIDAFLRAQFRPELGFWHNLSFLIAMERHPTPANLNALRAIGWDPAFDEETRKTALITVSRNLVTEERFRFFLQMYHGLPELYSQVVDYECQIMRPAGNEQYVLRMLAEIRRQPDRRAAIQLLGLMAAHVRFQVREGQPPAGWTPALRETLDHLLAMPAGRFSPATRWAFETSARELRAAVPPR